MGVGKFIRALLTLLTVVFTAAGCNCSPDDPHCGVPVTAPSAPTTTEAAAPLASPMPTLPATYYWMDNHYTCVDPTTHATIPSYRNALKVTSTSATLVGDLCGNNVSNSDVSSQLTWALSSRYALLGPGIYEYRGPGSIPPTSKSANQYDTVAWCQTKTANEVPGREVWVWQYRSGGYYASVLVFSSAGFQNMSDSPVTGTQEAESTSYNGASGYYMAFAVETAPLSSNANLHTGTLSLDSDFNLVLQCETEAW